MMNNFEVEKQDKAAIMNVVRNIRNEMPSIDVLTVMMDLTACHANGCPLDLERMQQASADELWHDIHGINRHLDRETGKLLNCFLPRYAKKGGNDE